MTTVPAHPQKLTTDNREGLVVFILGARINRWWLLPIALPILSRVGKMLKELRDDPDSGLLGLQPMGSATIQYWKSLDHLLAYTDNNERAHRPTTRRFYQRLFKNRAVGIWHELYVLPPGHYEGLYANMPTFGLGTCRELLPAQGALGTARRRLHPSLYRGAADGPPLDAGAPGDGATGRP